MITGGEPLLFPEKLSNLAESIRTVQKLAYGNKGKLFLYTALADMLPNYIRYFDGVVYTPHSANDVHIPTLYLWNECTTRYDGTSSLTSMEILVI